MSEARPPEPGVQLPSGDSASTLLLRLLRTAAEGADGPLGRVRVPPSASAFKKRLAGAMVDFEQRRRASPDPAAHAAAVVDAAHAALGFTPDGGERRPLAELAPSTPLEVEASSTRVGRAGWTPELRHDGESYAGERLVELIHRLGRRFHLGTGAGTALHRALTRLDRSGGALDLSGERFALLGAGAEIAPTRYLLEAGATVLWCDVEPPPPALRETPGRLMHTRGRADLLTRPDQVAATVAELAADEGPVHLGLFAYGPGEGREWRLGAAMNAVARALPDGALSSVGFYVSPTTPAAPEAADRAEAERRFAERPAWQRALGAVGLLRPNRSAPDRPHLADVVVPLQGVSYQATQYVEKVLAAEALRRTRPGLRVSSVVAPVTRTRSMSHPVFAAAFRGARIFGVEAFPAEVTRTLAALLYVEDLLGEDRKSVV